MTRGTFFAMVLAGYLVHVRPERFPVRTKVSGTEISEDPPVPIPEVKDKGNSIPGYRTSDPHWRCRVNPKPDFCCELEAQWTRYWYNATLDECKEVLGSKCCYEELKWETFDKLEDCNNLCLGLYKD